MFNPDAGNLGGKVGFIFGGTTFIGFVGCWFLLPETKDRTSAELDELYARDIKPRHFHTINLGEHGIERLSDIEITKSNQA